MQSDLDECGVSLFALSKDTVDEAAIHKSRDASLFVVMAIGNSVTM